MSTEFKYKTELTKLYEAGMYDTLCFKVGTECQLAYYYPEAIQHVVARLKLTGHEHTSWMWSMPKTDKDYM